MNHCKSNQFTVNQGNQSSGDSLPKNRKTLRYTIKNQATSGNNLYIGLNEQANPGNLLQPGESMTIGVEGYYVYDDIYLGWDPTGSGGQALVVVQIDLEKEICD